MIIQLHNWDVLQNDNFMNENFWFLANNKQNYKEKSPKNPRMKFYVSTMRNKDLIRIYIWCAHYLLFRVARNFDRVFIHNFLMNFFYFFNSKM